MSGQPETQLRSVLFGTDNPPPQGREIRVGPLSFEAVGGAVLRIVCHGVEVLRAIDVPVRDGNWATSARQVRAESVETGDGLARYVCDFTAGAFEGALEVRASAADDGTCELHAALDLTATQDALVNRAGFILLHPLAGVVGAPLRVTHSDGSAEDLHFPEPISPGQPAFDIAAMSHLVDGVAVDIAFEGEIFEMEDQRNWSDASYKTYCRPLGAPRPFRVPRGETVRQAIRLCLTRQGGPGAAPVGDSQRGVMPAVDCAFEPGLCEEPLPPELTMIGFQGVQVRIRADAAFPAHWPEAAEAALEIILPEGADPGTALAAVASAAQSAGFRPGRVTALPEPYLASIQPEGPWPGGPTPEDAAIAARAAFPEARIGGGMLTNFTELNRCPPRFATDFVTFGTTAIVHDANDRAVMETLEALPHIFASAADIAGERPVRLGLASIGMRSNPYGAGVAENPGRVRLEMAMDDPRQSGLFGAAFAVGYAARAAMGGIASFAPAMAGGPLGLTGPDGVFPLFHVVRGLAALAGRTVTVTGRIPGGLVTVMAPDAAGLIGIAANLSDRRQTLDAARSRRLGTAEAAAARAADWLDTAPVARGPVDLAPYEVAFINGGAQ